MVDRSSEALLDLPAPAPDYRLAYGPDPQQFGDLRLPPGPGLHPLAIALHGGFWREKYGLDHLSHLCAAVTAAGIATWCVEYRRVGSPGGGYPGTLDDVALGARQVGVLAARYPIDISRVAAFGHSAGGQLALWLGARRPIPLRGVVALAPVSDLVQASALRLGAGITDEFLGGAPGGVPARYADASPRALLPLGIRQLLLHGRKDDTVPISMSEEYVIAARAAGDDARLHTFESAGHFELIDPRTPEGQAGVRALRELLAATP